MINNYSSFYKYIEMNDIIYNYVCRKVNFRNKKQKEITIHERKRLNLK